MGEKRNAYRILVEKLEGNRPRKTYTWKECLLLGCGAV
jgi:hypothetical protein